MHLHATYPEAEPLSWRDVEALPYYAAAALTLAGFLQLLSGLGPELQDMTVKAALVTGILVARHALLGRELTRRGAAFGARHV